MRKFTSIQEITKEAVEELLYKEAELLDSWELDKWLELVTDQCGYYVPANDVPDGDHRKDLFLIADDNNRLRARVKRLKSRHAHIENPKSRTRRLITNIRLHERTADTLVVKSNFAVYRFRRYEQIGVYVGEYTHKLKIVDGQLKIDERRAVLDLEEVGSLGTVSIIL